MMEGADILVAYTAGSGHTLRDSQHAPKGVPKAQPNTPAATMWPVWAVNDGLKMSLQSDRSLRSGNLTRFPDDISDSTEILNNLIVKRKENMKTMLADRSKDLKTVKDEEKQGSDGFAKEASVHKEIPTVESPMEPFPTLEDVSAALVNDTTSADLPLPPPSNGTHERGFNDSPTITVACAPKSDAEEKEDDDNDDKPNRKGGEDEDRENMTLFKTWGIPPPRDRPRSRVRKIILTGLPANTDLTLVQSLVSGGAIENFTLSPGGKTAYVTFTTGDACDGYYDKFPNGISFKFESKPYTAFVDKSSDVDVISGVLQGHLDCGATRCVRLAGVDEDWGMRSLNRLAQGNKPQRKVENIIDSYRNGIRTIVFRFTSIADAVQFRAGMLRSIDFEDAVVDFAKDPCEVAEGVHMD